MERLNAAFRRGMTALRLASGPVTKGPEEAEKISRVEGLEKRWSSRTSSSLSTWPWTVPKAAWVSIEILEEGEEKRDQTWSM